jgi:hypothetical protein
MKETTGPRSTGRVIGLYSETRVRYRVPNALQTRNKQNEILIVIR